MAIVAGMAERTRRTRSARAREDWTPRFLEELANVRLVKAACKAAGVARSTAYERRDSDEAFAQAWRDIVEDIVEDMEAEAYRRAVEGWVEREIFNEEGEAVGEVHKYSDALLQFILRAHKPEKYRERHEVKHSGVIEQRVKLNLSRLTDEQLAALEAIQPDAEPDAD